MVHLQTRAKTPEQLAVKYCTLGVARMEDGVLASVRVLASSGGTMLSSKISSNGILGVPVER
jgi:hypothetical protein